MPSTALITGASSGIGMAMARVAAKMGYNTVLVARDEKKLKLLQNELTGQVKCTVIVADLSRPGIAKRLFQTTRSAGITVDILVNNAGIGAKGEFIARPVADAISQIAVNTRTLTELCHHFGREMVKKGRGKILNVGSIAGFAPGAYMTVYYATKAYVQSFSEALHEELSPHGVQVSVLCPGPTRTDFAQNAGSLHSYKKTPWFAPVATAEAVAEHAIRKFLQGKTIILPGIMNRCLVFALRFFPRFLARNLVARANRPRAQQP